MLDELIVASISGGIISFCCWIIKSCWINRKYLKIFLVSKYHRKKRIRLSISYLFKIKINNKYLLIKGRRIEQYQPVGGVFKTMESFDSIQSKYNIYNDNSIEWDKKISSDLRINVPAKNLVKVIQWFHSRKNREISVFRELYEELISPGFLSSKSIEDFNPEYLKTVNTGIVYSTHFRMKELLIYEIYTINLTKEDKDQIIDKMKSTNELILVTEDEIHKECISCDGISRKIGAHSKHII